jgi:two-component system chemotaxis sensor kinase CheA
LDLEALKKSFLKKFQEDTADRLQKIQLGVLDLEKPESAEAAEAVARELHTMKGEARILGLGAIGQLAHAAEDVLRSSRDGKTAVRVATDLLLRACDAVSDLLVDTAGSKNGTPAAEEMCRRLAEVSGHGVPPLKPGSAASLPAAKPPLAQAESAAPAAPPPASRASTPEPGAPGPAEEAASRPGEIAAEPQLPKLTAADRSIRVNVEILDQMGTMAGDLLVESARARLRFNDLNEILERFSRMGDRFLKVGEGFHKDNGARKQVEVLERDLHLLRDDAFRSVRLHLDGLNTLHGNLAQLADDVAEARLVPLGTVFDALPRAVREMAHQQGKEVELVVENPNVGVDRSMLSDVRDALVHLLRNGVDHGLEGPELRETLGKPRAGKLHIRVRADGDMLHLEVMDDGCGIDPERVKAAAVARQLLTASQAAAMGQREALDLIFLSGLSTREEVSELSGRGVGMDVVKRKVESLGGSVAVHSRLGRGTTISLRLPQTLALMRVLLVRLGGDVYGMPAAEVEAVARVHPEDRVEIMGTVAIQHRGKPTALVALGPLLGLNGGPTHDRPPAVVVRHGQDRAALAVDGFVDEREVAVKPCGGEFLKGAPFIAGTAALEDGRIAVLLHVPDLMAEVRRVARPVTQAPAARRLKVLLIDDSPIARATESALVKALGHIVDEAQDGEEGLALIQGGTYDLILTDVQMPKMDGFALTRRIKTAPELSRLPVIILSSLASPEDKRRGLDAGADAYLVKGELGVESLAQTIDRLT